MPSGIITRLINVKALNSLEVRIKVAMVKEVEAMLLKNAKLSQYGALCLGHFGKVWLLAQCRVAESSFTVL